MNTYPSLAQMAGSVVQPLDDVKIDRAVNGAPKLRSFYDATKNQIRLVHWCSIADKATLDTYYNNAANKHSTNLLVWVADGTSYTVYFAGPPQYEWQDGKYTTTVDFVEA